MSTKEIEEQLSKLLERTEEMGEHLKQLEVFRKIRRLGSRSKKLLVLVVAAAVILYWRGLWALYDLFFEYALPGNRVTGAVISVLVGAIVLIGIGTLADALGPVKVVEEFEEAEFPPAKK